MKFSIPMTFMEQVVLQTWWIILFSLLCLMIYEKALRTQEEFLSDLRQKKEKLLVEKKLNLELKNERLLTINSQSDPAFVELTLMKVLGVVPEGQAKVLFKDYD